MPTTGDDRAGPVLLAVDGGASKTDVVLVGDGGAVLGHARGGASNHQMVGLAAAMDNLAATVDEALGVAGLPGLADRRGEPVCDLGVYCLAGLDLPVDDRRVGPAVAGRRWTARCELHNDAFAVLRAGSTTGWGVGVVCGTGLNCVGLAPDGATARFPSLGELSGDFTPGGTWLAVRGLGLALRAGDGRGRPTTLRRAVADHLGLASPEAVLEAVYDGSVPFASVTTLAEVVLAAADAGDDVAQEAVDLLAGEAAAMVTAAVDRLGLAEGGRAVEVVTGGGIFESRPFGDRVLAGVRRRAPSAVLRPLAGRPPVLGAALLGLDAMSAVGAAGAGPAAEARLRQALGSVAAG